MLGESPRQRGQESMKIAVVGLYSIKNVGDNVLCSSTIHLIRERQLDKNPVNTAVSVQFVENTKQHLFR